MQTTGTTAAMWRGRLAHLWLFPLLALLAACAGATEGPATIEPGDEKPVGPVSACPDGIEVGEDALCGIPTIGAAPEGTLPPPDEGAGAPSIDDSDLVEQARQFLVQEGEGKLTVYVNETVNVGVRVIDTVGQPVPNHRVGFAVVELEGAPPSGVSIDTGAAASNAFGAATVKLTAGPRPAFVFLQMTGEDTTQLTYQVNVVQRPEGYNPVTDPDDPNFGGFEPVGPFGECLQTAGVYSIRNHYEPARLLGDGVFNTLDTIRRALSDPGELVADLVTRRIGGIFGSIIRAAVRPVVNYLYRYVVQNYAPDWARWMLILVEDITSVLTALEIEGTLNLGSVDEECRLTGTHEWTTLVFYWRAGCPPGANENCGRNEIPFNQLGAGLSRGEFAAEVSRAVGPVGDLTIGQHNMTLNLGVALLWFVQNVILPQRFNVNSFGELLEMIVPCDALGRLVADYVGGSVVGFAVAPFVRDACRGGMRAAGNYLTGLLSDALSVSLFQVEGNCKVRDTNGNRFVDVLEEGRWTRGLEGRFSGQRLGGPADPGVPVGPDDGRPGG